jgi:hypothetical protein
MQIGVTDGSNVSLSQFFGSGSRADLLQFGVSSSRIRAYQVGSADNMLVQQTQGTSGSYAAAEQVGTGSTITLLQGQPSGGVMGTHGRVFQYGDSNSALTVQANLTNSASYISQGSPQMPGSYYTPSSGWVTVDAGVVPTSTNYSNATVFQTGGSSLTGYILQYGSGLSASVTQSGDANVGGILQAGGGNSAFMAQSGFGGTATISQQGNGLFANVNQSGMGNTATIKQR